MAPPDFTSARDARLYLLPACAVLPCRKADCPLPLLTPRSNIVPKTEIHDDGDEFHLCNADWPHAPVRRIFTTTPP